MSCVSVGVEQAIKRDTCVILRERHATTTREATSVTDHSVFAMKWSPNQKQIATLSEASPRIRLWNVALGLKGVALLYTHSFVYSVDFGLGDARLPNIHIPFEPRRQSVYSLLFAFAGAM